jgi:hypothetical protein
MEWTTFNYGLITLDKTGVAIKWSEYGTNLYRWNLSQPVYDLTAKENYVAFSLGSSVDEY